MLWDDAGNSSGWFVWFGQNTDLIPDRDRAAAARRSRTQGARPRLAGPAQSVAFIVRAKRPGTFPQHQYDVDSGLWK